MSTGPMPLIDQLDSPGPDGRDDLDSPASPQLYRAGA
jgi:hypothetical protein